MKRFVFFTLFLIGSMAVSGILWITHDRAYAIVHPARGALTRSPESIGITQYQNVSFLSADKLTLKGWYIPPRNGSVIIFVHGHAGNRLGLWGEAVILIKQGYGALLFDLRNSGESEGSVTTFGLQEVLDVRGAVDFVLAQPGVDPNQIGLLGRSMGGATALMATARIPEIRAVIAESTYTRMEDNIQTGVQRLAGLPPFPFAPLIIFWGQQEAGIDIRQVRPIDDIATLSPRPVLLVHGELDDLIPVVNAHQLYEAAHEPKELYLIPNAGHGGFIEAAGEAYARKITEFFNNSLVRK